MNFSYSRHGRSSADRWMERIFETIPATLSWSLLISMTLLCILAPVAGVIIVILFDLYWLFRLIYLTIFLVLSYLLLEIERLAAWHTHLNDLLEVEGAVKKTRERLRDLRRSFFRIGDSRKFLDKFKTYYSEKRHLVTLERLQKHPIDFPPPNDIHHLVIIPFYREGVKILEPTIQALTRVNYPLKRITVALGVEDRAGEGARKLAEGLKAEYGPQFGHFEVSVHPQNLPGESAVKGANATHAARWAKSYFEERKISLEHVIVSCFDCDTIVSPGYFSCLTYNFLIHPKRTRTSFQPIPVYHNNIWEAPSFACVVETGSSFIQLIEVTDPEQLVTFSSHSMSFQALVEIGYWPIDLISDDSAIFWKAFLAFDGDYRVQPLYVTLSMDVAVGGNLWETCQSIYRQKRRWAWGVENFPILVRGLLANSRISLFQKVRQAFRLLEMNVSWATWTPIMLILSWAPALFATREFAASVAHFNAPRVAGVIGSIAAASLVISIILSFSLLPKRPKPTRILQKFFLALQWLLVPVIATVFGALPALDAQTRLAFGRYMEFFVAPKRASEEERAKTLVGQTSGSRNEPDRRLHG